MVQFQEAGVNAVLLGKSLMCEADIAAKMREPPGR